MPKHLIKPSGEKVNNTLLNTVFYFYIGCLFALLVLIEQISSHFDYVIPILQRPTYFVVLLMCLAGLLYLLIIRKVLNHQVKLALIPLFIIGLMMRILFMQSTPIYEDDFYRYFFDGSLISHGVNPYQFSPQDALPNIVSEKNTLLGIEEHIIAAKEELAFLADEPLMKRVAYPHISTIYPSITQAVFTLSYQLKPFNLTVWRLLLLMFDVINFFMLIQLLKHLNKPLIYSAIYWLNPIVITETINAAHMDILLIPALLGTLLFIVKQRYPVAGLTLAIAVGIKIWPILLIPSIIKPLLLQPKKLAITLIPCIGLILLLLTPQLINYTSEHSGLQNYSEYWRTNSFLFGLLEDTVLMIDQHLPYYFGEPEAISRYIIAGIMGLIVIYLFVKGENKDKHNAIESLSQQWLIIIACLFLLSPTSYPWYFIWFLPLLVIKPTMPLLLLTMLLPLYDLRYPFIALDKAQIFNNVIITIEFLPTIVLLLFYFYQKRNSSIIKTVYRG